MKAQTKQTLLDESDGSIGAATIRSLLKSLSRQLAELDYTKEAEHLQKSLNALDLELVLETILGLQASHAAELVTEALELTERLVDTTLKVEKQGPTSVGKAQLFFSIELAC